MLRKIQNVLVAFALVALILPFPARSASGMGTTLSALILNHGFRTTAWTQPTNVYLALCTGTAPTTTASAISGFAAAEVSSTNTNYARYTLSRADASWSAPSSGSISNASTITLNAPNSSANWGTVTWMAIVDVSGNILAWGQLQTPRTINAGDSAPTIAAGALVLTLT